MARDNTATIVDAADDAETLVPVALARLKILRRGKPIARTTLLSLAAVGELDLRRVAGRYVVTGTSIQEYNARNASVGKAAV